MLQPCPKCGAANSEQASVCFVCDALLLPSEAVLEPVAVPSSEPDWRREVAHRLEAYRARQKARGLHNDSQVVLPFSGAPEASGTSQDPSALQHPPGAPRDPLRTRRPERVEIAVLQPSLDFSASEDSRGRLTAPLVPVAELGERFRAGLLDAAFLLAAYVGFLLLFRSLGGQFSFGKLDALVYAATLFLFYAQYFALCTALGGATPGMRLRGLRVVSFDGSAPGTGQLLWRSFGYLVSGATALLGFLWSLWDEDRLTWQDRISQTYVTSTPLLTVVPGRTSPLASGPQAARG